MIAKRDFLNCFEAKKENNVFGKKFSKGFLPLTNTHCGLTVRYVLAFRNSKGAQKKGLFYHNAP